MHVVLACCLIPLITACGGFDGLTDLEVCNATTRKSVQVVVTDDRGTPLEGLSFRTVHVKTGSRVVFDSVNAINWGYGGFYPVITNLSKHLLSERGDVLRFVAWDENWVATATFVAADGGCHVVKRSGPDTVVAF